MSPAGTAATTAAGYSALSPARILDTRSGNGAPALQLGAGSSMTLQVTGRGGVPASGVSAVVLNVTVTDAASGGCLAAWPAGEASPLASNLNYVAGQTVPNLVMVKVGAGGAVNLYSSGGPRQRDRRRRRLLRRRRRRRPGRPPCRRPASSTPAPATVRRRPRSAAGGQPVAAGHRPRRRSRDRRRRQWSSTSPSPSRHRAAGWPPGRPASARPLVSNLNFVPGQTVPNLVVVKVGAGGKVNLYSSGGPVHVIADVAGWFVA